MDYYPLTFDLKGMSQPYLWGGRKLAPLVPDVPADEPVAEIWAVSDRPEEGKVSRVLNGPLTGQTFQQLIQKDAVGFLGFDTTDHRFPILLKLMDPKGRLSVQVHPPAAVAEQLGGQPKAEAWLGLAGSDPDAYIYGGLKRGVTREQFETALKDGSVEALLHRVPISAGTVFDVPNGRIHGIGEGCLLLEVQQSSDTTYRVFDYNRVDPKTGTTRQLHVKESLASIDFADQAPQVESPQPIADQRGSRRQFLTTDYFTIEKFTGSGEIFESTNGLATIVVNLKPQTTFLISANEVSIEQKTFECSLLPAALGEFVVKGDDLDYALIRPVRPEMSPTT